MKCDTDGTGKFKIIIKDALYALHSPNMIKLIILV